MDLSNLISSRDIAIEKSILSKILTIGRIPPDLSEDFFGGEEYRLYKAILEQWQKYGKIDVPLLKKKFEALINDCLEMQGSYSEASIEILEKQWIKRELGLIIAEMGKCEDPQKEIRIIQEKISHIMFKRKTEEYNQQNEIVNLKKMITTAQNQNKILSGYSCSIKAIDNLTNGFELSKFYACGALKKTAKSRFGVFCSLKFMEQGAGIFWNSLEMSREQLNILALSYYSGINSRKFGKAMGKEDFDKSNKMMPSIENLNWCIYNEKTIPDLKSRFIYEKNKRNINVIFVDYIQRMKSPKFTNKVEIVEDLATGLADLSRDLKCCIIAFSQLSGEAEKLEDDEVPNMSHFKNSQAIAEAADVNMILHNPNRHKATYSAEGKYIPQKILCRIEQRWDVSGYIVPFIGDLRTCNFYDSTGFDE